MFIHKPYLIPQLEQVTDADGKRVYIVDGQRYKSVTTLLGQYKQEGLQEWRIRVGDEEANRVSKRATRRGKSLDKQVEDYLNNKPVESSMLSLFPQMKPALDKHVTLVNNLQGTVYSHILKIAGSCDLLGQWDGIPSIVDFKTAKRLKEEDYIESYFLQCTAYTMCLNEMLDLHLNQIVVLIGVDHEAIPQIFVKKASDYIAKTVRVLKTFNK